MLLPDNPCAEEENQHGQARLYGRLGDFADRFVLDIGHIHDQGHLQPVYLL